MKIYEANSHTCSAQWRCNAPLLQHCEFRYLQENTRAYLQGTLLAGTFIYTSTTESDGTN